MATLHIDEVRYRCLMASAAARDSSPEAEIARIIDESVPGAVDREQDRISETTLDFVERMRARHAEMVAKRGYLPDSTELIRRMRDEE